jgi:mannose-6-phosphate isomerase-like protein (cupin superfamily)
MTILAQRLISSSSEIGIAAEIAQSGCAGPVPILSPDECAALSLHLEEPDLPAPFGWAKGRAVTDRVIYDIAAKPDLIALLRPLLGEDIVLWGAQIVHRPPGTSHPWHTDVESAAPDARVISVWVGVRNTSRNSGLLFVAGSQHFGRPVQEVLAVLGEHRDTIADARMLEIARTIDPATSIVQPDVQDGAALIFDGRIWHSGRHDGASETRTALLLQYASADCAIPMPVGGHYHWPFRFSTSRRVPTILVSDTGLGSANRLVPPPPTPSSKPMIMTFARTVELPLAEDPVKHWRPFSQFRGPTSTLAEMSCHISVLSAGHAPHPPHIHGEEELLIVLDGAVEIELADDPSRTNSRRHPMKPGMFSYYPATQHHTIHNTGAQPATYLMFKWRSVASGSEMPLPASIFEHGQSVVPDKPAPMATKLLFQQATDQLPKLHAHLTTLQPGAGYEAHADPYDVAIILFSGEVETVGERVKPLGVIYYSAGELHGMRNVGAAPATYLVFEFHTPATVAHDRRHAEVLRQAKLAEEQRRKAEKQQRKVEEQRRKAEKQRRKRGVRGLLRKLVKAAKKLVR